MDFLHHIMIAGGGMPITGVPITSVFVPRKSLSAAPEMPRSENPPTMAISARGG